jgi:hypothetical protein
MNDDQKAKALTQLAVHGNITTEKYIAVLNANPKLKEAVNDVAKKVQSAVIKARNQLPVTITAGSIPDLSELL